MLSLDATSDRKVTVTAATGRTVGTKPAPQKQTADVLNSIQCREQDQNIPISHINSRRSRNVKRMVETVRLSVYETIDKSKKKSRLRGIVLRPIPLHRYSTGLSLDMNVDRACQGACLIIPRRAGPSGVRVSVDGNTAQETKSDAQLPSGTP